MKTNETGDKSRSILTISREINIFSTILVIFFGLIGHILTIYVFGQRRFRLKSGSVYLLCLSVNDSLFLIIHLFEDTIRTFKDIYLTESHSRDRLTFWINFLNLINITDKHDLLCRLINYLRYTLRFISAYIIVAYTLQRLSLLKTPYKFRSIRSAWNTVFLTVWLAFLFNMWVPFLFEIQSDEHGVKYCDMNKTWKHEYFTINVVYICLIMLLPIIIIFISNSIIIYHTIRIDRAEETTDRSCQLETMDSFSVSSRFLSARRIAFKAKYTSQIARVLILISFSYAFLSLPYFVSWCMFFYEVAFSESANTARENYLFSMLQICEIFFILNYSIHFYLYCASDTIFCTQLGTRAQKQQLQQPQLQQPILKKTYQLRLIHSNYRFNSSNNKNILFQIR